MEKKYINKISIQLLKDTTHINASDSDANESTFDRAPAIPYLKLSNKMNVNKKLLSNKIVSKMKVTQHTQKYVQQPHKCNTKLIIYHHLHIVKSYCTCSVCQYTNTKHLKKCKPPIAPQTNNINVQTHIPPMQKHNIKNTTLLKTIFISHFPHISILQINYFNQFIQSNKANLTNILSYRQPHHHQLKKLKSKNNKTSHKF